MELLSLSTTNNSCISVIIIPVSPILSSIRSETEREKRSQQLIPEANEIPEGCANDVLVALQHKFEFSENKFKTS